MKQAFKLFCLVGLAILCTNCQSDQAQDIKIPNEKVEAGLSGFKQKNGTLWYDGKPFSGYRFSKHPNGKIATITGYWQGKKEGEAKAFYATGKPRYQKFYHQGKRTKTHYGWYSTGKKRFIRQYNKGLMVGVEQLYYRNGRLAVQRHFENGKEQGPQKEWSEKGKLVSNYVVKKGRRYGVLGRKNCVSVYKNEKPNQN
ncbi:MAG TPA: hypothetical protein DCS93_32800 [Microscillaceae bacterium]|nr:hypothetical protein [Microscillaceae bacterium]